MSVMFIVVVGADNVPIYLKSRNMFLKNNDDPSIDIDLLYELHSSLDIVEERSHSQDNRDQYLGRLLLLDCCSVQVVFEQQQ